MKPKGNTIIGSAVLAVLGWLGVATLPGLEAQNYRIGWFKITAGQGASTNRQFSVVGAVGQPDAHPALRGGNYSLHGGFYSFLSAVQTPGAPLLSISFNGPQKALISWPATEAGFTLQQTSTLTSGTWVDVAIPPALVGGVYQIEVSVAQGSIFYRLHRQ